LLDERQLKKGDILINSSGVGTAGRVTLFDLEGIFVVDSHITILRPNQDLVLPSFVLHSLASIGFKNIEAMALGQSGQIELALTTIQNIKIPLPPKDIQEKIVAEIEVLEAKEVMAKAGVNKLKENVNSIVSDLNELERISIDKISENLDYKRKPVTKGHREKGGIPYYGASGIVDYVSEYVLDDFVLLVSEDGANLKARTLPIAFTANGKIWVNNHAHILRFKDSETHKLVELYLNRTDISEFITGQAQPKLSQANLNRIKIPLPATLEEQQKIVAQITEIENKIAALESELSTLPQQKEAILKKYL
jgi:restriction endonuclease S subunit